MYIPSDICVHEDCVVDVTIDSEGKECLCPYCLNLLSP